MRRVVLLLCGWLFVSACAAETPAIPRMRTDRENVLGDWWVVGPWVAPQGRAAIAIDFLAGSGGAETSLSLEEARKGSEGDPAASRRAQPIAGAECVDFSAVFRFVPATEIEEAAGYAWCVLEADEEREAWLLFGSDAQAAVWLNGEKRYESRAKRSLRAYDDAIRLPLRRGENLLLVKAVNIGRYWTFNAKLAPDQAAAVRAALSASDGFFQRALVAPGEPLTMLVRGMPETAVFELELQRYDGTPVRNVRFGPREPVSTVGLPEGLYRLVNPAGGPWSRPAFYIGDCASLHRRMQARCAAVKDERTTLQLSAYVRRLEILKEAQQTAKAAGPGMEWAHRALVEDLEYKAVYAAAALEDIFAARQRGEEPFRHRPGLHLRGFRSRIDDQAVYYRIFVPSSYRPDIGPGLPLFIMPQPVLSTDRPFLESAFVARQREAEDWARVAEGLGVAILWPGYRVRPYGNPIDFAHFEEALAAVRADYRIDPSRLYLHGYCSTGLFSAMEVIRHPRRYAAVAMVNPVLHRVKGRFDERADFPQLDAYRAWLRETDPVENFDALAGVPLRILHDELDPDHGPLAHTVELVEKLRATGGRVQLDHFRTPAPRPIRARLVWEQLAWLCRQRRPDASDERSAPASAGLSVADALGARFVVVRGTGGSPAEQAAAARWTEDFAAAWRRTTSTPCRVVDDVQLSTHEENSSNLVLIGTAATNGVWKRLAAALPVTMAADAIIIGGRRHSGRRLSLQAVFPHPTRTERCLVLVGSADPSAGFGTQELAIDGWFSYAIWESDAGLSRLLSADRPGDGAKPPGMRSVP